jgi:phage terminase large subunit-like protein
VRLSAAGRGKAAACIRFIEGCCVHTIGKWAGEPFVLTPWQRDFVEHVFGVVDRRGIRIVRTALLFIARKQGKSELAAAIALFLLIADGEAAPQVYGAAKDSDQAGLVFAVAADMVRMSEYLNSVCDVKDSIKRIVCPENRGYYRAIPADAAGAHGFNASGIIYDELHTAPDRTLWDVLRTSTMAREQPLTLAISTAGIGQSGICWEMYELAGKVISRNVKNRAIAARIFEVPEGTTFAEVAEQDADGNFVRERDLWPLANPSLEGQPGGFLNPEGIREKVREAIEIPSMQNSVLQLHFNQWVGAESHWLNPAMWRRCHDRTTTVESLAGRECWGGLDLASGQDFCSWALVFPWPGEKGLGYDLLVRCYLPKDVAAKRTNMRGDIDAWSRSGWLTLTEGNVADYNAIFADVMADAERYTIREIGYDPFLATNLVVPLTAEGLTLVEVRQGPRTLTPPIQLLERLVLKRQVNHFGNRLLAWQADNVVLAHSEGGLVKLAKEKSREKIDAVAATVTALERAMAPRSPAAFAGVVI